MVLNVASHVGNTTTIDPNFKITGYSVASGLFMKVSRGMNTLTHLNSLYFFLLVNGPTTDAGLPLGSYPVTASAGPGEAEAT